MMHAIDRVPLEIWSHILSHVLMSSVMPDTRDSFLAQLRSLNPTCHSLCNYLSSQHTRAQLRTISHTFCNAIDGLKQDLIIVTAAQVPSTSGLASVIMRIRRRETCFQDKTPFVAGPRDHGCYGGCEVCDRLHNAVSDGFFGDLRPKRPTVTLSSINCHSRRRLYSMHEEMPDLIVIAISLNSEDNFVDLRQFYPNLTHLHVQCVDHHLTHPLNLEHLVTLQIEIRSSRVQSPAIQEWRLPKLRYLAITSYIKGDPGLIDAIKSFLQTVGIGLSGLSCQFLCPEAWIHHRVNETLALREILVWCPRLDSLQISLQSFVSLLPRTNHQPIYVSLINLEAMIECMHDDVVSWDQVREAMACWTKGVLWFETGYTWEECIKDCEHRFYHSDTGYGVWRAFLKTMEDAHLSMRDRNGVIAHRLGPGWDHIETNWIEWIDSEL